MISNLRLVSYACHHKFPKILAIHKVLHYLSEMYVSFMTIPKKNVSDFLLPKIAFQRQSRSISQDPKGIQRLENATLVWKIYIERLTKTPFSTFTTTEMVDNLKDKRLAKALKAIDSAIYGGNFSEKTMESVNIMVEIANAAYQTERRKIKLERKKK